MTDISSVSSSHERWIARTLRTGVWSSAGCLVLGLILSPFHEKAGLTLTSAGLIFLMFTPILRVLTTLVTFAAEKDRRFVIVSSLVFAMLLVELAIAYH